MKRTWTSTLGIVAGLAIFALSPQSSQAFVTNSASATNDIVDIESTGTLFTSLNGSVNNAFDGDVTTQVQQGSYPEYAGIYAMDKKYRLTGFTIANGNTGWRWFYQFRVEGSNDTTTGLDGSWTTIYEFPGSLDWQNTGRKLLYFDPKDEPSDPDIFNNDTAYHSFRLVIIGGSGDAYAPELSELEFFGYRVPDGMLITLH